MPSTWSFRCIASLSEIARAVQISPDQSPSAISASLSLLTNLLAVLASSCQLGRSFSPSTSIKGRRPPRSHVCRRLGLPISGLRAQVEARLRSYRARLQAAEDAESQTQSPPPTPGASLAGPAGSGHPPPHVGLAPTAAALAQLTGPSSAVQSAPAAGTPGRSLSQGHLSAIAHSAAQAAIAQTLHCSLVPSHPPLPASLHTFGPQHTSADTAVAWAGPPALPMPPPQLITYYQPPAASTGAVSSLHSQLTALQPAVSAGALTAGAFAGLQPQFTAQQPVVTVGVTHCPHTHFAPPHPAALAGAVSAPPGWQPQVTAPQPAVTAGAAHSLPQLFTIQPAITAVSPSVLLSTQQQHTSQLAIPGSHTFHLAPLNTSIPPLPTRFAAAAAVGEFVELLYCIELGSGRAQLGEDQQLALSRKPKKRPVSSFEEWVKCFTVYSNNLCAHNPSRGPDIASEPRPSPCYACTCA